MLREEDGGMDLSLEAEDANDWLYRGEGAAKIVLAYAGTLHHYVGKVIRVQKVPRNGTQLEIGHPALSKHEQLLWTDIGTITKSSVKDTLEQLYVQSVMVPLLGPEFIDVGLRVHASMEFLESIERNVLHQRPSWRVHAAKVNTLSDSVHLMSDHSIFPYGNPIIAPCISVEIKPKCGFLPSSKFIAEHNGIKRSVTRFKMHQLLKMQEHELSEVSHYDPLDLFSGSKERIHRAITALFATPQNNLRVFLNGSIIYGGLGGGNNATKFMDCHTFENYLSNFLPAGHRFCMISFVDLIAQAVFESGVMDRLLRVQKLDGLDIEGAIHAYYDIISQPCMICRDCDDEKELSRYTLLHSISLEESVKIVKEFLIAATAKDCGLMISFRAQKDDDSQSSHRSVYLKSADQYFDYKAHFIDLDMKPLKKMEYYYKLDQRIVSLYTQLIKERLGTDTAQLEWEHGFERVKS